MTRSQAEAVAGGAITGCIVGIAFLDVAGGVLGIFVGAMLGWLFGPIRDKEI